MEEDQAQVEPEPGPRALLYAVYGFVYGLYFVLMSILVSGAGHGWGAASITAASVFVVPFLGVAYAYRNQVSGRIIAGIVFALAIMLDIDLVTSTIDYGTHGAAKVWAASPMGLTLAGIMWFGWQLLTLLIACGRTPRFRPPWVR